MTMSLSAATLPVFKHMLTNLSHILDKGAAHAEARKFDAANLLTYRLAPDMLPFTQQIQIACDAAKFCVSRLAGSEGPKFEDTETTLAELRQRIRKTIDYVQSVPAAQIDGSDDREITVPRRAGPIQMKGEMYLKHFVLPNFFFHVTTVYALLRHNGVNLGKSDFLANLTTAA